MVSLGGAPVALPSFATSEFQEFFRLGRALRVTLLTGKGGVLHLVVYGYKGRRRTLKSCSLLISFFRLSLLRPRWCVLVNLADPAVIHCLAKGIPAGKFVDLALAYSLGAGVKPDASCKFRLEDCVGSCRDFIVSCSNALAASTACKVTDWWFTPHFSVLDRDTAPIIGCRTVVAYHQRHVMHTPSGPPPPPPSRFPSKFAFLE